MALWSKTRVLLFPATVRPTERPVKRLFHIMASRITAGIFASGSPARPEQLSAGIAELERLGFSTKCPLDPGKLYHKNDFAQSKTLFGAASATERAAALMALVDDPDVNFLIAARGGYGSAELLPLLDLKRIAAASKPIIGGSDVTALLAALFATTGAPSIHGPMVATDFARQAAAGADAAEANENVDGLLRLLAGSPAEHKGEMIRDGQGRGPLLAGNLTVMLSLLSTPWDPKYDGTVLVIEDVGEAPYRIHRTLTQLRLAGKLSRLAGLVFGRFNRCEAKSGASIDDVLRSSVNDALSGTSYPVMIGLPFGHDGTSVSLPVGVFAELSGGILRVESGPWQILKR